MSSGLRRTPRWSSGSGLVAQYEIARHAHRCTDPVLADLARMSVWGSAAPDPVRRRLLAGIDAWLAAPDPDFSL